MLSWEKTKMIVFNRGRNGKKETWRWEAREVE